MPYKNAEDRAANNRRWAARNPESRRLINARCREKHGIKYLAKDLIRKKTLVAAMSIQEQKSYWRNRWHKTWDARFGWEKGTHKKILAQAIVCALCGEPFTFGQRKDTDHDHKTNKFRGIVHHNCNIALGLLSDSEDKCLRAAAYLRRHNYGSS